jgi:hypothetical protein
LYLEKKKWTHKKKKKKEENLVKEVLNYEKNGVIFIKKFIGFFFFG